MALVRDTDSLDPLAAMNETRRRPFHRPRGPKGSRLGGSTVAGGARNGRWLARRPRSEAHSTERGLGRDDRVRRAAGQAAGEYRSIAFESGAPLEKYLGWVPLLDEPGLRTIVQWRGPVRRCLIVAQGVPPVQIDEMVQPWSWLPPAAGHLSAHSRASRLILRLESQRQRRRNYHNDQINFVSVDGV
jgi:hypothetical protein